MNFSLGRWEGVGAGEGEEGGGGSTTVVMQGRAGLLVLPTCACDAGPGPGSVLGPTRNAGLLPQVPAAPFLFPLIPDHPVLLVGR